MCLMFSPTGRRFFPTGRRIVPVWCAAGIPDPPQGGCGIGKNALRVRSCQKTEMTSALTWMPIERSLLVISTKVLHTDAVASAIDQLGSSRVLNTKPPPIDKSDSSLTRLVRTTLSQLRSEFCSRFKSFQFCIEREDNDLCPECGSHSHDTAHLFNCQAHPIH